MKHWPIPHMGAWAVVHQVPGTETLHVVMTCRTLAAALEQAALLSERATA